MATVSEIAAQGWSLNPGRYGGTEVVELDDEVFEERLAAAQLELRALGARAAVLRAGVDHVLTQLLAVDRSDQEQAPLVADPRPARDLCSGQKPSGVRSSTVTPTRIAQPMNVEDRIKLAGDALAAAAPAGSRIVLFGSHARGDATERSDLDFLVIEEHVSSKLDEMVRLRDALPPLGIPIDALVVSALEAEDRRRVPGTLVHRALSEGLTLVVG